MIKTECHLNIITDLLAAHNLPSDIIELVPEIQIGNSSPFCPACTKPDPINKKQRIYLIENVTDEVIAGIKSKVEPKIADFLTTDILFLKHLILHEIRHIQHNHNCLDPIRRRACEDDCDLWAYEELKNQTTMPV
jgi:hypothetical protein